MIAAIKAWWRRQTKDPFTVVVDRSPFRTSAFPREELYHVTGLGNAKRLAERWVCDHPHGCARVVPGHVTHEDGKLK